MHNKWTDPSRSPRKRVSMHVPISIRDVTFWSKQSFASPWWREDWPKSTSYLVFLAFSNLNRLSVFRNWAHLHAAMFRFLFARRGKGNISPPVKTQRNTQLATENVDMPTTRTFEILRPVILVSAALSGYTHPRYRVLGIVGGFVWLTMLLAHGTLDFLAARQVYTYGWASVSLSLCLLCFLCTIFTNKRMLPWLEKGMSKLEDDQRYPKTLERCAKVFKVRECDLNNVVSLLW